MVCIIDPDISPDAVCCDENGNPVPILDSTEEAEMLRDSLQKLFDHQKKCSDDATAFLQFYFRKNRSIDLQGLEQWLAENQHLDRWFYIRLIEMAGQRFLDLAYSGHKAAIARAKNAVPRTWVLSQWDSRVDKGQTKAAFGRQYALLVKSQFGLVIDPITISRDWLPKVNK